MIFVGIDVAKDKHDCFILNSEGTVLADVFTIANNRIGFETLLSRIQSCSQGESKIKVGLEATGHYSYNLLGFLLDSGLATYVINPLHTNLYRKSLSLRRTKTDRIDARTIAMMLMSDVDLKSYSNTAYHNEELKSLTRYRFDKVKERAKLKSSVARLVNILFPELEKLVSSLHIAVVYALLSNYPGASYIANANTEELAETLCVPNLRASMARNRKSRTHSCPAKFLLFCLLLRAIGNCQQRSVDNNILCWFQEFCQIVLPSHVGHINFIHAYSNPRKLSA